MSCWTSRLPGCARSLCVASRITRRAAAVFESAGHLLPSALALGNIGETHAQLGNYTRSLEAFERARRALSSLDAPVDEHDVLLETANTYLALNLYPEAALDEERVCRGTIGERTVRRTLS